MRKLILVLLVLLCACSSSDPVPEEPLPSSETQPVIDDDPEGPEETKVPEKEETPFVYPLEQVNNWETRGSGISFEQDIGRKTVRLSDCSGAVLEKQRLWFAAGNEYTITMKASSENAAGITVTVSENGNVLLSQYEELYSEEREITLYFYNRGWDIYDVVLSVSFADGTSGTVHLDDILVRRTNPNTAAAVNQLGYLPDSFKTAVFSEDPGNYFTVFDAKDDTPVLKAPVCNVREDSLYGEFNYLGEFSALKEEGVYYLISETGVGSYNFVVNADPYGDLYKDVLRFITLQRCGTDIPEEFGGVYGHAACHTKDANRKVHLEDFTDVRGGWHDAGDYGRYMQTSVKAAVPLLLSHLFAGDTLDDTSLEAGNGIPDVLDEVRYGLDWMLKMQEPYGSVLNKVTTMQFAGLIRPEDDDADLYVLAPWTLTAAGFAGTAALGALAFAPYDREYSEKLVAAAELSGQFLLNKGPDEPYRNPSDFSTGDYNDSDESDERFFAYAALYLLTGKKEYYDAGKRVFEKGPFSSLVVNSLYGYGRFLFIEACRAGDPFREKLLEQLINDAENDIYYLTTVNYPCPIREFNWGSNQWINDRIFVQEAAWYFTGQDRYLKAASHELNYLLGENCFRSTFVTGYGYEYPRHIHHRIAMISGTPLKGALVSGVAQYLTEWTDGLRVSEDTPIGRRYIDNSDNYATSEVAIGYNGCFYLALSFFVKADD